MRYGIILLSFFALIGGGCKMGADRMRGVDVMKMKKWAIIVDENAIPAEKYAAEEFQRFFEQATDLKLPIRKETGPETGHVFIGAGPPMKASSVGFDTSDFGPEDLRVRVKDDAVAIAGGRPRGTLYGVYTFMEELLGVRFLTSEHTHIPKLESRFVLEPIDFEYRPPLEFRYPYYGENKANPEFAVRTRVNTITRDERLGGRARMRLINHSFSRYLPTRKYGDEHPEYFAFVNGERRADVENDWGGNGTQPCLTNPEVLEIVTQGVLADLEKHPLWRNISVSMNDNRHYCRCPECRKVDEQAGSHMGALLKFVNEVARAVRKEHPDVMVGTLAYLWSRQPPKGIEPEPNVQIQLCSIECCLIHPISDPDCPMNVEFCRDLDGWSEICDKIYIWNYNTNFHNYLLPCPNLRVIGPNVKYFVEKGAKGLFMQAAGNTQGAELSGLRNYMIANLLWDPRRDAEKLKNEFLELHYSEAAPPIKEFIELVHDCAEASGLHNDCYGWAAGYGLDESVADAGIQAFEKAMELAEGEEVRRRVEKASICAYRLAIEPVALAAFQSPWKEMGARPSAEKLKELRPMVRHLFDLCNEYDVSRVAEGMSVKEARNKLRKLYELQDGEDF